MKPCSVLPGSRPGGSRVIRRWGCSPASLEITYLITDREGLENQQRKRGRITWFTWNTNHHLRRSQASSHFPKGEEALRPPWSDLRSPGKISRLDGYPCTRWEFSQKNGEQERMTWGNQSFRKLIRFLYFGVCLYTFCYTQGQVSSPDLYQNQVLHINV